MSLCRVFRRPVAPSAKRYVIQAILSRSSFGITYLARNIYLPGQPLCVVKKLAPKFNDPQLVTIARAQFELEALTLSRLGTHAQIPTLLDYFELGSDRYLVEEYIPGFVLAQTIQQQQPFTATQVENFLVQMLRLLEYIHSHHLIHRDLKPQNIILCQTDRRFVLLDFGSVKDLDAAKSSSGDRTISDASRSIGTSGFAPPEQLANRAVYASDIYALGMTCICLLAGKEPSQLPVDLKTCELIWADNVDICTDLSQIISKMTQISLADRYHSATQVLAALENRTIRAKLRTYLDRKYAVSTTDRIESPAVVHWALGIATTD
ncbi:serine/threonine-protein kinase [Chamaesiphon minutus]|uniref:serine/threonine-protein kinase n=1 Tax=Chamaesiphon minutus TaxID=1173032 RepID=UPI0012F9BD9E|nr:serine/threonine-protein kinase [Chamaesiphon minutus]